MEEFKLDPFQEEAIRHLREGYSVVVSAPTGAGKTLIAERVIEDSIGQGEGVIYTAPIKALSNQKYRDFSSRFPGRVGIVTGDVSINPSASIIIMTTEIFRNHLLESPGKLQDKSWVIFDEIHYLDDVERGTVWEESIILLPSHMRFLALSATIPNINSFINWIKSIHGFPVKEVVEKKRPVPLHFYFQFQNRILGSRKKLEKFFYSVPHRRVRANRVKDLVKHLRENDRLPAIYFAFSRRKCEDLAWEMAGEKFLSPEERERLKKEFWYLVRRLGMEGERWVEETFPLLENGVAYHHAGLLPMAKEIVERLFTRGLIKLIFTTETFALGINMPARSVCFDDLVKSTGRGKRPLKVREFQQMAGRAGRRGMDREGFVYIRVNPRHVSLWDIRRILGGKPEAVRSQFNTSYATLLNLYEQYGEGLLEIYPRSFHYYQQKKRGRRRGEELIRNKLRLLEDMGYIEEKGLTSKGKFSAHLFGYELILGELFGEGFLQELSSSQLALVVCAVVTESRRRRLPRLTPYLKKVKGKLDNLVERIRRWEKRYRVYPLSKRVDFYLVPFLDLWIKERDFDRVREASGVDEGEIIRNFRMCIQVLRSIGEGEVPVGLRDSAMEAMEMIKWGVVDAEKELEMEEEIEGEVNHA